MFILVIVYLIISILLISIGLGLGFLLHWLIPDIGLGIATLIGLIASTVSMRAIWVAMDYFDEYEEEKFLHEVMESMTQKSAQKARWRKRK